MRWLRTEEQIERNWKTYFAQTKVARENFASRLAQGIPLKTGRARAVSLKTLLDLGWDKSKLPPVSTFFNELSLEDQHALLEYRWKQVGSAALLPLLRQLVQPRTTQKGEDSYARKELGTLALRRLYELAPDEGRRLILAAMKRPNPMLGLNALMLLPDETLPELDHVLMDNFEKEEDSEITSALIERYASPALYSRVSQWLADRVGQMGCYPQSRLLAYALRANAAGGLALIRKALSDREHTHCYSNLLGNIAILHFDAGLESLALETLNDADSEAVSGAVNMLGVYGSASSEAPLWRKFEQWHHAWIGRKSELDLVDSDNQSLNTQRTLERALHRALSQSPAWLAGPAQLARLNTLCISKQEREANRRMVEAWGKTIALRFTPSDQKWGGATVAQYEATSLEGLKQKLAQFPQGTVFEWHPFNAGQLETEKDELFQSLQSFLAGKGMRLVD